MFLFQVVGGSSAKRYGGKFTLTVAVLLWSLSTLLTPFFAAWFPAVVFLRVALGIGEGFGLPTIFHIFSHVVPAEERSRAFGYLVALGSVGQTIAALVCPHLPWEWSFYSFGFMGIAWTAVWICMYNEVRVPGPGHYDEEFAQPPKVSFS